MSALLDLLRSTSAYSGGNAAFIEGIYERYLQDPQSVDPGWRRRFDELQRDLARARPDVPHNGQGAGCRPSPTLGVCAADERYSGQ